MSYIAKFEHSDNCKIIVRDSYRDNTYYGLDDFDCKYLRILQAKFGCQNSFHTIPDRVKMEMAIFEWNAKKELFELSENKTQKVQLCELEYMVVSHTVDYV